MKKFIKLAALAIAGACLSVYSYTLGVADASSIRYGDVPEDETDQETSSDEIAVDTQ